MRINVDKQSFQFVQLGGYHVFRVKEEGMQERAVECDRLMLQRTFIMKE